jgi:hypothetical protein
MVMVMTREVRNLRATNTGESAAPPLLS